MALTIGKAPFSRPPGGAFNFDIERAAPNGILYLEDVPKRIRGVLAGETIVDTRRSKMLFESGQFAQWYIPVADIRAGVLEPSGPPARDPLKGERLSYAIHVGDRLEADAAWGFSDSPAGAPPLAGLVAIAFDRLDAWFEEDEETKEHPRDPYHRFDCRRTSDHVEVRIGGQTVADTRRAVKLFETSAPPRFYIPREDVTAGALTPSDSPRTFCPYKGAAAYYTVNSGGTTVKDGAWMLPEPLGEAIAVLDHVSFWGEGTEVIVEGQPTPI